MELISNRNFKMKHFLGLLKIRGKFGKAVQKRSVGGQWGTYVHGRQSTGAPKWGVQKFTARVKSRSQARLHRWQTSSDSSRLIRTVGKGGAKRDTGQNDSKRSERASGGTRPGAHHLGAYQEVLFILFF